MPRPPVTASVRIKRARAAVFAQRVDLSRHDAYLDHFLVDWKLTSAAPLEGATSAQ